MMEFISHFLCFVGLIALMGILAGLFGSIGQIIDATIILYALWSLTKTND